MNTYKIYLKGGAVIEGVKALRIEFPETKSKTLKIYVSEGEADSDLIILASEVAAVEKISDATQKPNKEGFIDTGGSEAMSSIFSRK